MWQQERRRRGEGEAKKINKSKKRVISMRISGTSKAKETEPRAVCPLSLSLFLPLALMLTVEFNKQTS